MPLPRIKRNYDETSFRLLALEIQNSAKPSDNLGGNTRTKYHIQHGTELLDRGLITDAEKEFHEALQMEPVSAAAHAGLAKAAEARGDMNRANGGFHFARLSSHGGGFSGACAGGHAAKAVYFGGPEHRPGAWARAGQCRGFDPKAGDRGARGAGCGVDALGHCVGLTLIATRCWRCPTSAAVSRCGI